MPAPATVVFDVNETLFSLDALEAAFGEAGLPDGAMPLWFARILRDGFALAATSRWRPFRALAAEHLQRLLLAHDRPAGDDDVDRVLAAFAELDAHPDVRPALERLRDAGVPAATLTVGDAGLTRTLLDRADLGDLVTATLSCDDARLWKPRADAYHHAARTLDVPAGELALVAVHSWDVHGAHEAGLRTGWCSRLEGERISGFSAPDVTGESLVEVVDGLLAG
jgi:2-haloacid dehalogenase